MQTYRARNPKKSPLWQCAHRHFSKFERIYPDAYQPRYGRLRTIIPEVVRKFLACGDLERGFARVRCEHCNHEYLLAFSCKSRWFCPSCHQKHVQTSAQFIVERVLPPVPHRHFVLAIPKMLRPYFQRHRILLKSLCTVAKQCITEYLRTALGRDDGMPAIILTLHTFGEYLDFHPHVHAMVADGLFVCEPANEGPAGAAAGAPPSTITATFLPLPETPLTPLEGLFRARVIQLLVNAKLLPPERVQVLYSWKHSGFNVHIGEPVPHENKADLEGLAQYILRNPFSVEKMTMESPGDTIIYRSRLNAKINRNFEVFSPTDFLAAITQHIPDKGAQMVRYYGWYSNKTRGQRNRRLGGLATARRPGVSPPPPANLPSKRWRDLIERVWHVNPLRCPVCQSAMHVIAVIDDPAVVRKILRHLALWHDPPPSGSDLATGGCTSEPWLEDPLPDYDNVLTD